MNMTLNMIACLALAGVCISFAETAAINSPREVAMVRRSAESVNKKSDNLLMLDALKRDRLPCYACRGTLPKMSAESVNPQFGSVVSEKVQDPLLLDVEALPQLA